MPTYSFENVIAWQKAHNFALLAYRTTQKFPINERFGLCDQFQRAALRFFNIAQGSLEECRNYILLVRDLKYISDEEFAELRDSIEETSKFLNLYCKGIVNNNGIKDEEVL